MNERWTDEVLAAISDFESTPSATLEGVQTKLQSILALWNERTAGPEYDLIDLAENSLEEILHARSLADRRDAAIDRLQRLRADLLAQRP